MQKAQTGTISMTYGTCYGIIPENHQKTEIIGILRGKLRIKTKKKSKNTVRRQRHLLAVGDSVLFSFSGKSCQDYFSSPKQESHVMIENVIERKNSLERSNRHEIHCLGSNLDRAIAVVSLKSPWPRFGFLDRFLCASYAGGVESWILFSKKDLLNTEETEKALIMASIYQKLNFPVYFLDLLLEKDMATLRKNLSSGATIFLGQSGVGKSTLLNQLSRKEMQAIGEISLATNKGRHKTTNSRAVYCSLRNEDETKCVDHKKKKNEKEQTKDVFLIDTPGLKEWGLMHLERKTILESFPEIRERIHSCKFSDCTHHKDSSGCAVEELLEESDEFWMENGLDLSKKGYNTFIARKLIHFSRLRSLESILSFEGKKVY